MKKILLITLMAFCFSVPVFAAQETLDETTADLGGAFGNDFKLTMFSNWEKQANMNTELYGKITSSGACSGDDLVITFADATTVTVTDACLVAEAGSGEANVQVDWNETDTGDDAFIPNKPTIPTRDSLGVDTDDNVSFGSVTATGSGGVAVGVAGTTQGSLTLYSNASPVYGVNLAPAATPTGSVSLKMPPAASGGDNYLLNFDANGTGGWTDPATFQTALTNPLVQGDVDDTPVNGVTTAPVSSNWAYDHEAASDPHTGYVLESAAGAAAYLGATNGTIGDVAVWVDGGSCSDTQYTTEPTCEGAEETWTAVAALPVDVSGSAITDTGNYFTDDTINGSIQELGADVAAALTNPMTTAGDLIKGGTSGAPARMVPGTGVITALEANANGTGGFVVVGNAAGASSILTGYTSGAGTVAGTDTILEAVQKLNGNAAAKQDAIDTENVETSGTMQGKMLFNTYAEATTLTFADHNSSVVQMTVIGEVTMWDCETAGVGAFVSLWAKEAEKIEVVPASGDHFVLFDGTALTADYELDMAATAGTKVTLMCTADDTWSVYTETAASVTGGAAD